MKKTRTRTRTTTYCKIVGTRQFAKQRKEKKRKKHFHKFLHTLENCWHSETAHRERESIKPGGLYSCDSQTKMATQSDGDKQPQITRWTCPGIHIDFGKSMPVGEELQWQSWGGCSYREKGKMQVWVSAKYHNGLDEAASRGCPIFK